MLTALSIKNYALIDELDVSFNNGFTIITGQTGAGKSILLGGLSLVLGKRADLSQIKDVNKKCIIEATFDVARYNSIKQVFDAEDLDYEAQTIIRREILPSGKSRAFVNDTPVKLDTLNLLSSFLIDVHSQHQTQQLTDDSYQFKVIDALANNSEHLNDYTQTLKHYKKEIKYLEELNASRTEALKAYDYNTFLLKELEDAQLEEGQLEQLEESYEALNNVEVIGEKLGQSKSILNNEQMGIIEQLNALKRSLSTIENFGSNYKNLRERVESTVIELDDILSEIDRLEEQLISDPAELNRVSEKLELINNLFNKHGHRTISELLQLKEELSEKVIQTEGVDDLINEKEKGINELHEQLTQLANTIHKKRTEIIPDFIKSLETLLADLGMPNAKFKIDLSTSEDFKKNGTDSLQFLFTANKGSNFTELKKAASGGELSRIMLSIKSILAKYVQMPTIMFDEIDTGVSGEISHKMGEIMKSMSRNMQVFAITHLPQIAAKGDSHFKVFKVDNEEQTETNMKVLSEQERIVEIAQMLGGIDVSDSAIAHAKELLN